MAEGGPGRRRRSSTPWLALASAVAVVATYFLPWARSGRVHRTAFELARAVDVLGLADGTGRQALLVGFWVSPILVAAAWTAVAVGWRRAGGLLVALVGVVGLAAAVTVMRAGAVRADLGPRLCIVLGVSTLVLGVWLITRAQPEQGG